MKSLESRYDNTNAQREQLLLRMAQIMVESATDPYVSNALRGMTPRDFWRWFQTVWVHAPDANGEGVPWDRGGQEIKWPRAMLEECARFGQIAVACAGVAMLYGTAGVVNRGTVSLIGISQGDWLVLDHVFSKWNGAAYDPVLGEAIGIRPGEEFTQWTVKAIVPVSVAPWQASGS